MAYSIDSLSADCYPGTTCLVTKLNIRDEHILSEYETAVTIGKAALLDQSPVDGAYDFEHYKEIHRFLFEDLYDWAGKIRTVDMSKKGTVFVKAADIEKVASRAFGRMNALNNFADMPFDEFISNIVEFYDITNRLHPFREGNGRTQRVFFTQLIRNAGYDIFFSEIDTNELMIATIQCAHGVSDNLYRLFHSSVKRTLI